LLRLALIGAAGSLAACTEETLAVARTARIFAPAGGAPAPLRTDRLYLRVVTQGRTILMVLGGVDRPPPEGNTGSGADIESWYSGAGEILRLQDGRIVSTAGLLTDWRAVRTVDLPRWDAAARAPVQYERERDQMPAYRYGMREAITLRSIPAPASSALRELDAHDLAWFEESARALTPGAAAPELATDPARFALQGQGAAAVVVYAEQCLAPDLCLSWQRWPVRTAHP
jgi:hypothetical protein